MNMKKITFPLEYNNRLKFFVTTHPKGSKFFFDTNKFLYIKNYLWDSNYIRKEKIMNNISDVLMRDCFLSNEGDYEFLIQKRGKTKIIFDNRYLVLNKGDGFIFDKSLNICKRLGFFVKYQSIEFYTHEYKYPDRTLV